MRKIYIDSVNHCHTTNPDGNFREVETDFFDGKCDTFVEGYSYEVKENGYSIYPWKPYSQLDAAQREHERQLLAEYEAELAEMRANSIPTAELAAAYQEGVNSV